jgi:hypothetical protein
MLLGYRPPAQQILIVERLGEELQRPFIALIVMGISPSPVMKMIGM